MESIGKYIWYGIFHIMLWGNFLWVLVLNAIGSVLNVSWIDVEHVLRPFAFVSYNEIMAKNGESEEYINAKRKNIDWFKE